MSTRVVTLLWRNDKIYVASAVANVHGFLYEPRCRFAGSLRKKGNCCYKTCEIEFAFGWKGRRNEEDRVMRWSAVSWLYSRRVLVLGQDLQVASTR